MVWQALAWLTPVHLDQQKAAIAHMVVHAHEVDHHHHADQSLHLEEDHSASPHQHANQAAQLPGLPPTMTLAAGKPGPSVLVASTDAGHAPVFLEGLLRPPQRSADLA